MGAFDKFETNIINMKSENNFKDSAINVFVI